MHQQLQQQPKPRLQLILEPKLQHEPKPGSAPTPARRWETVPPPAWSQIQCLALTSGSSMADRPLVVRKDEGIPQHNKMDEEIASAVNRALFQLQAPAHVRIMKVSRNARGTITAITHQKATAEMTLLYQDIINKAAR